MALMPRLAGYIFVTALIGGCASGGVEPQVGSRDPSKCPQYKATLEQHDAKGTPALASKSNLTHAQKAEVAAYNDTFAKYLHNHCHTGGAKPHIFFPIAR